MPVMTEAEFTAELDDVHARLRAKHAAGEFIGDPDPTGRRGVAVISERLGGKHFAVGSVDPDPSDAWWWAIDGEMRHAAREWVTFVDA